jgi:hypothetical protein
MRLLLFKPWFPCVSKPGLPEVKAFAKIIFSLIERASQRVVGQIDAWCGERVGKERKDMKAQSVFCECAWAHGCDSVREAHSRGASVREASSSGKKVSSSA